MRLLQGLRHPMHHSRKPLVPGNMCTVTMCTKAHVVNTYHTATTHLVKTVTKIHWVRYVLRGCVARDKQRINHIGSATYLHFACINIAMFLGQKRVCECGCPKERDLQRQRCRWARDIVRFRLRRVERMVSTRPHGVVPRRHRPRSVVHGRFKVLRFHCEAGPDNEPHVAVVRCIQLDAMGTSITRHRTLHLTVGTLTAATTRHSMREERSDLKSRRWHVSMQFMRARTGGCAQCYCAMHDNVNTISRQYHRRRHPDRNYSQRYRT